MSRYKDQILCLDIGMTEDDFKNMYKSLLCGTKFELSKKIDTKKRCERYRLIFKAFYYDDHETRKYLLTNDERRKIIPVMRGIYSGIDVSSFPSEICNSISTNENDSHNRSSSRLERSLVKIALDGLMWKVLGSVDGVYLVTAEAIGGIDSFCGIMDSMKDETGEELLDRIDNIMRIVATCSGQELIRKMFPSIDRIWDNGRITSTGRYDDFRTHYLKIKEDKQVTVRLYNIIAEHEGKLYLRYQYKYCKID